MAGDEYEANEGLKMMEELTKIAAQIQEQMLAEILPRNAAIEYLKGFLNGQAEKQLFKKNVPIVKYEDIWPDINRIANGEPSDILLADPVIEFYLSSGTSGGGQSKLILATVEDVKRTKPVIGTVMESMLKKHFGDLNQTGKRMEFMFTKPEIDTPCCLKATSICTSALIRDSGYRNMVSMLYTSPIDTIFCFDTKQSMYCQLLAGLIQRDQVVIFASKVLRAIKFLEDCWIELCSNIRTGNLSDWINDSECRNAILALIVKPNPELANLVENICGCNSWEGIITKLWPKAKYIGYITTGVMSQYSEVLEPYCGGLPLVSTYYGSSEAFFGVNLEPLSKPSAVSYTFLPNIAYFEFLHVKYDCVSVSTQEVQSKCTSHQEFMETKSNNIEDIETIDLVNVKLGQCYEVLTTNFTGLYRYRVGDIFMVTGFHNNTPQFKFVDRQNVILSLDADKTSESDLLKAVTEAWTLIDPLGFILKGYTSYGDTSSTPGHYVIFWELKASQGNDIKVLIDSKIMVECCNRLEESLNDTYKILRKENAIAALEIGW